MKRCPKCNEEMMVTYKTTTKVAFLVCPNGYSCYHCELPIGESTDGYEVYMPNYDNNMIDYIKTRMEREDDE